MGNRDPYSDCPPFFAPASGMAGRDARPTESLDHSPGPASAYFAAEGLAAGAAAGLGAANWSGVFTRSL